MAQIIATPKDMRIFAQDLERLSAELKDKQRRMEDELQRLGVSWQDDRYRRFSRAVTTASVQFVAFHNRAKSFVEFLGRKAAAGERYLSRG